MLKKFFAESLKDRQRIWSDAELQVNWSLGQDEWVLIRKYRGTNRLKCAALLKYSQFKGPFPRTFSNIPLQGIRYLSKSLKISSEDTASSYDYLDATGKRQRRDRREFLGIRQPEKADSESAQRGLVENIRDAPDDEDALYEHIRAWFVDNKIELPPVPQMERIVNSALVFFEERRFRRISDGLSEHSRQALDRLFMPKAGGETDGTTAPFSLLKVDPGKPSLNSVFIELTQLAEIDALNIPSGLFEEVSQKTLQLYRYRAATKSVWDMRRHPEGHSVYACGCVLL